MKVYSTKENHCEQGFLVTFVGDCLYLQLKRYGFGVKDVEIDEKI